MLSYIEQLTERLNNTKTYLILVNVFLVFFLILFNNLGVLPMRTGDFIFFSILILAFALYRPGWFFVFFMGTIALENINLAPQSAGLAIRPYQLIGGLLILAVAIRYFSQKLYFKLAELSWVDYLVFLVPLSSLLNIFNSQNPKVELKFILIIASFAAMFLLVKNYIQNIYDLKKSLPFFLSSTFVIMLYGFWQNIRFAKGLDAFSVMPGRPNSTLTEPDWLGFYLILIIACAYALVYFFTQKSKNEKMVGRIDIAAIYIYLTSSFSLLLISVSRSAWIGTAAMTVVFLLAIFTSLKFNFHNWQWKSIIEIKLGIIATFLIGLGLVYLFHLTTFQLFNRAASTGGAQKITVSCESNVVLPEKITSIDDLTANNCHQINLEEIATEKKQGHFVTETNRADPNVSVRAEIYRKSLSQIKEHPILGIGWSNIPLVLGKDARGANLNSSNIFLETYLGSGLIGFLSLTIFLGVIFIRALIAFFRETDLEQKTFALFVLTSCTGLVIFNLFNAGIMLGFFWVWLGIASTLKVKKV